MKKKSIMKKIVSFLIIFSMVAGIAFSNVATKEVQADETTETNTTELRPITFADFNLADGDIVEQTYGATYVSSANGANTLLTDVLFSGYLTLNDDDTTTQAAHLKFGYTDGWGGLSFEFAADGQTMTVNTGNVGTNGYPYKFSVPEEVSSFKNTRFKLSFSLEKKNLDNVTDEETGEILENDLLLKVYINDTLCEANEAAWAGQEATYGSNGEYYIFNMDTSRLMGYIRKQYVGTTEGYYNSITVESCELPYTSTTTFENYGINDQIFTGAVTGGEVTNTMEYTKFSGDVTIGGSGTSMINYGATTANNANTGGLQIQITADTGAFWIITGTRLGGGYLNEPDASGDNIQYYSSGLPVGESFKLSFNTIPWDYDGDGVATDGKIEIRVDGKLLKDQYVIIDEMFSGTVTLVNRIGLLAGSNFGTACTSTLTVASEKETTEEPDTETQVDKRILTFADFGLADGTYTDGFSAKSLATIDSTKLSSVTLADSEISGYIQLKQGDRTVTNAAYLILGGTGWAGVQVLFNPSNNRIQVTTSSITSTNPEAFTYVYSPGFEEKFKLTISFDTVDADGQGKNDLLLKVYINDKLCTALESAMGYPTLSLSGTEGEYYIHNYTSDNFKPYMVAQNISSTNAAYYESIYIESCELPYRNTTSFVDYGIADQTFDGGILTGKYPGALEYTKLSGHVTLGGAGACMINYGGTATSEADTTYPNMQLGGLRLQMEANTGKIWIIPGTRLGGIYLNEATESTGGYANALPVGQSFELSLNTIPWDYDGDGAATDGKIEIRVDGKLLKDKYVIIDEMFSESVTLVNRFSLLAGGHFGSTSTLTVTSESTDTERFRKVELADFGLANGLYNTQSHVSKGPASLFNTMMEMNVNVTASTSGSQIHYAVPLEKGGWYGVVLNVKGDTLTVRHAEGAITGGTIKASEINDWDTFYGKDFRLGLSIEKIDLHGDGANDDARLGVWIEGELLRNYYFVDNASEVGTGMSVFSYLTAEELDVATMTVSDVTEESSSFDTVLGLEDMNASGVTAGIYGYKEENPEVSTALGPKNTAEKGGSLDDAIFSTNIRFSSESARLFYGCSTESGRGWYGLWIGASGNAAQTFNLNYAGGLSLLDIHAGVAGVKLYDNTYKLSISSRTVDSDGDDVFDDLEVGVWFNDKLYNNTYVYLEDKAGVLEPNIAVYSPNGDGHIVLGNYTQETASEIVHCADDFAYFVDGDEVTVANEAKGTSWNTSTPGEYAVTYTNTTTMGTSTFKENILVYKTNDVTADGIVSVVDLVAMKKLAAGLRSETTVAGKKAVGYVESSEWYTTEVQDSMYAKLLADENTIQAKVMSDDILGETGSLNPAGNATYITSLGATKEGTSVIGISDVSSDGNGTYTTDIDAFDGSGLDFVLDFDTDREIKVLQVTDTQIIDSAQCRSEGRLHESTMVSWATDQMDNVLFNELKALIAKEQPDLIVMTGDNVYGEFDDSGESLQKLIAVMDEFKIPWAPIFGNHDNETALGVSWQCEQFAASKYCIFNRRNEIGGNGNYSIGISVQGKIQRTIFMMDTNGCSNISGVTNQADKDAVTVNFVFHDEQMAWYQTVAAKVNEFANAKIPSFLCVHVPLAEVTTALVENGYQAKADAIINGTTISHNYTVGNIVADGAAWTYEKDEYNNFGFKEARTIGSSAMSEYILPYLKAAGTDGTFFGHQHINALSVEWEGIRFTYGLKTGRYDASPNQTGGTVITLNGSEFDVNHVIINNLDAE